MNYIRNVFKTGTISFKEIGFGTSIEVAKEMKKEILYFFDKNPTAKLILDFDGTQRLLRGFADELFKDEKIRKYFSQIKVERIHQVDYVMIDGVIERLS